MNSVTDRLVNDCGRLNTSTASPSGDSLEPSPLSTTHEPSPLSRNSEPEVKQRESVVQWMNGILPHLSLSVDASDEELRAILIDGRVLCELLSKLKPEEAGDSTNSPSSGSENLKRFLLAMEKMELPRFQASDLENGSMKNVFDCLIALQTQFRPQDGGSNSVSPLASPNQSGNVTMTRWKSMIERYRRDDSQGGSFRPFSSFRDERRRSARSPVMAEASAALMHHVGHKFHEVFQFKQESYADLPASKISEMMKPNSLDNAPTQSLLTVVNGIIDESIERKNGEIPHRVACLLRKVVQEIERRISTQAEHLRMQNNLFKAREEKYQSRIRVLEALATGTSEETQIVMNQLQQIKSEKSKMEVKKKSEEHNVARLKKEKDETVQEIAALKQELDTAWKAYERDCSQAEQEIVALKQELETTRKTSEQSCTPGENSTGGGSQQEIAALKQEPEAAQKSYEQHCSQAENNDSRSQQEIAALKQQLETARKTYEQRCSQMEQEAATSQQEIAALKELKQQLETARRTYEERCSQVEKEASGSQQEIQALKQELETARKTHEQRCSQMENKARGSQQEIEALKQELETARKTYEQCHSQMGNETGGSQQEIEALKQELETARKTYEQCHSQMGNETGGSQQEIEALKQELETARKTYEQCHSQMENEARGSQQEIQALKEELETTRKTYEQRCSQMENEARGSQQEIEALKQELETARKTYEQRCSQMEKEARGSQQELEEKLKEVMSLLTESRNRVRELEILYETKSQRWIKSQSIYEIFTEFQLGALRELKFSSQSIRQEVVKTQKIYIDEFNRLGVKTKALEDTAANYYIVLAENKKLHNEVQELKGNIRVYCRVRPFLPGQKDKQTIVEYVGDNGELIVMNPSKQGKEGRRSFRFNKVYNPTATQAQVFSDIQPLIRSVLDGYSVCIFAYGQTGSGKTYTMTGPDGATEEQWGVNYRSLNDLFQISQKRRNAMAYEIAVQMVEIYNEQIRDLLSSNGPQKSLSVLPTTQPNGLAVPDASMYPVNATSDVLDLMNIGLKNRAKSSTALNERSSRSHSVVTIHVSGTDLRSGSSMRSSLHLVDLAGSERVDRSEVKGDRLKEAQHINKSLAALGDVISALAQKSSHVPYRNSKLTQVLQSSLGGQAKTLMFVQLNPDHSSYSESVSTLKFAERVSGVELGAAKSSKDSKDVRELMEQVASLKDTIGRREEEIDKLRLGKDVKVNGEKRGLNIFRR
ncbi:kinesin-like protein KIN-14C isoform X2 [Ipomoea triloba]|uniref:kinesin-like protein KIN-14C isoform X2 n=1 Tax=Ipomoea triloba TaxID=35885 RepID=UPI00125D14F6|nr:kinesin-like protein KIN-14C isoform X2 [Ipomoea triloba]